MRPRAKHTFIILNVHFWMALSVLFNTAICAINKPKPSADEIFRTKIKRFDTEFIQRRPHHDYIFGEQDLSPDGPLDFDRVQGCGNDTLIFTRVTNDGRQDYECTLRPPSTKYPSTKDYIDHFKEKYGHLEQKTPIEETFYGFYNICHNTIDSVYGTGNVLHLSEKCGPNCRDYVERNGNRIARQAPAKNNADFLKHTTIVSRLVNGIYLQSGLMDGKIPIDELAGEILNFGSVKVSDVVNFKPDKITALTNKLKEVSNTLNDKANFNSDLEKLESEVIKWNQLRKDYESVGDVTKIAGTGPYYKEVDEFKTIVNDVAGIGVVLNSSLTKLNKVEHDFKNVETLGKDELKDSLTSLTTINKQLTAINAKFETAAKKLDSLNALKNGVDTFKPLETMIHIMKTRGSVLQKSPASNPLIEKNIQTVVQLSTSSTSSSQDIRNIDELVKRRINPDVRTGKYTDGFPNGVTDLEQLAKDARDPWLAKITRLDISKFSGLTDGFQPISKFIDVLGKADDNMTPISTGTIPQSLMELRKSQDTIAMLSSESVASVAVLPDFEKCDISPSQEADYKASADFLDHVKTLSQLSVKVNQAVGKLDVAGIGGDVDGFLKSIGFNKGTTNVDPVIDKLKTNTAMGSLKTRFTDAMTPYAGIDAATLTKTVIPEVQKGDGTNDQNFPKALDKENKMSSCLKKFSQKAEKLAQSIEVVQQLRGFDVKKYGDVESAASTVSKVAKDLAGLKSMSDTMKKVAKERTTMINKMSDSDKQSKSIGQSVSSLQYAYGLNKLEDAVGQLKDVGTIVAAEIQKIANPSDRKRVEDQWGDHQKHVAELEGSLANIKAFDSKIDVSKAKTIGEYGAPLKDLATLSDAKINAGDKFKALETLIQSADPKNKDALEAAKKTLGTIATLDLEFSSHKGEFQSAPAAFKAFHDFLVEFISTEPEVEGGGFPWIFLVYIAAGGSLLSLVGYLIYRWRQKEHEKKVLLEWAINQKFISPESAAKILPSYMLIVLYNVRVDMAASMKTLGAERHRYPNNVACKMDTAVKFTTRNGGRRVLIHANYVDSLTRPRKFIATQGPLKQTFEEFWLMVLHHNSEFIVMLCLTFEPEETKDKKMIIKEKCGQYYSSEVNGTLTFGAITVTTKSSTKILDSNVLKLEIEIVDVKYGYGTRKLTHYQHLTWPDKSCPKGHAVTYDLMQLVNKSKYPVIVHCSAGIGRTVTFIGLDVIVDYIVRNPKIVPNQIVELLRTFRSGGVQKPEQLYWLIVGLVYVLSIKYKFDMKHYDEQYEQYLKALEILKNMEKELNEKNKREMEAQRAAAKATVEGGNDGSRANAAGDVDEEDLFERLPEDWRPNEDFPYLSIDPVADYRFLKGALGELIAEALSMEQNEEEPGHEEEEENQDGVPQGVGRDGSYIVPIED